MRIGALLAGFGWLIVVAAVTAALYGCAPSPLRTAPIPVECTQFPAREHVLVRDKKTGVRGVGYLHPQGDTWIVRIYYSVAPDVAVEQTCDTVE